MSGTALFGAEAVHESPLIMAGEDFSYYLHQRPGCFMFVGAGNVEAGIVHPHHHPKFDIDEKIHAKCGKFAARQWPWIIWHECRRFFGEC